MISQNTQSNNIANIESESSLVNSINSPHNGAKANSIDMMHWLMAQGSLTTMLEAKAQQPLIVDPYFEGYKSLTHKQKQALGMNRHDMNRPMMAWIRESFLYGNDDKPWIQAESIFPHSVLYGDAKRLKNLGSTPIGYVLYKRQKRLPSRRLIHLTDTGWQRQTLYNWHGRKLLISETFLEGFFR